MSKARPHFAEPSCVFAALADDGAEQRIVMAGEVLRRAVENEIRSQLERSEVDRRRRGRVDDDLCRMKRGRLEIRHRQKGVRRRFEPDEVDSVRRRSRLVELDDAKAPPRELAQRDPGTEVRAFRKRDRVPWFAERKR